MTKEIEDIIRNKAFFELNANELERVKEFAQNEEEFTNMKWFLEETNTAFASQKIKPPSQLKKDVMQHLTESKKKRGFWLNSVGVFLLPQGKPFYQKPVFQLGIAAAVMIGFLFMFNQYDGLNDNSMAVIPEVEKQLDEKAVVDIETLADSQQVNTIVEEELNEEAVRDQLPKQAEITKESMNESGGAKFDVSTNEDRADRYKIEDLDNKALESKRVQADYMFAAPESTAEELEQADEMDFVETEVSVDKDVAVSPTVMGGNAVESLNKQADMTFTTNSSSPVILQESVGYDISESRMYKAEEVILPKKLHIDQTIELNQLFFTEK